jgi:hypothetical protein
MVLKFGKDTEVYDPIKEQCTFAPKTNLKSLNSRSGNKTSFKSNRSLSKYDGQGSVFFNPGSSTIDNPHANLNITNSSFGGTP